MPTHILKRAKPTIIFSYYCMFFPRLMCFLCAVNVILDLKRQKWGMRLHGRHVPSVTMNINTVVYFHTCTILWKISINLQPNQTPSKCTIYSVYMPAQNYSALIFLGNYLAFYCVYFMFIRLLVYLVSSTKSLLEDMWESVSCIKGLDVLSSSFKSSVTSLINTVESQSEEHGNQPHPSLISIIPFSIVT